MKKIAVLACAFLLMTNTNRAFSAEAETGGTSKSAQALDFGAAQSTPEDRQRRLQKIDSFVNEQMAQLNIPAYCLAIIDNGQLIFQKPYGFADLATRRPATNDTVFGLASNTKTFTALTLLKLVDKGLVGLDDPLSKYIKGLTPPYQMLTIRQLASMCAGVPSKLSQAVLWKNQLEILDHTPLESKPGTQFLYSNYSYRLLGQVISNVTGQDYLDVVREAILAPLQMNSTATTVLLQDTGREAQAYGDEFGKGPLRQIEYKNPRITMAAGMLASTTDDLIKYVFGLMSGKMLSPQGYKTLWYDRPALSNGQPNNWAFGWGSGPNKNLGGQFTVSMNGGTPGVASTIIILPERKSAVIALCNLRKPPVYAIARMVARMAFSNDDSAPIEEEESHGSQAD